MNNNHRNNPDDALLASTLITYRRRTRTRTLRRLAIILAIVAGALLLYRFAHAAPPTPPTPIDFAAKPRRPDLTHVCRHRPEIATYPACIRSRPPYRNRR